jgi:hypothetical protein
MIAFEPHTRPSTCQLRTASCPRRGSRDTSSSSSSSSSKDTRSNMRKDTPRRRRPISSRAATRRSSRATRRCPTMAARPKTRAMPSCRTRWPPTRRAWRPRTAASALSSAPSIATPCGPCSSSRTWSAWSDSPSTSTSRWPATRSSARCRPIFGYVVVVVSFFLVGCTFGCSGCCTVQ